MTSIGRTKPTNMATFVVLRHPVTTLVIAFNKPGKLTNDLFILKIQQCFDDCEEVV